MSQDCLPLRLFDEGAIEVFLNRHLPRCDCPRPVIHDRHALRAACVQQLAVLREQRAIAEPVRPTGPIEDELCRYDQHMRDVRGVSPI
jgi:hypothetical protein